MGRWLARPLLRDDTRHPSAPAGALSFATASADSTAKLWAADGTEVFSLTGHASRLARLAFHPMGRHLGTASYDHTWRLWDVERGECLLEQEGHSRPVYTVAFQVRRPAATRAGPAGGKPSGARSARAVLFSPGLKRRAGARSRRGGPAAARARGRTALADGVWRPAALFSLRQPSLCARRALRGAEHVPPRGTSPSTANLRPSRPPPPEPSPTQNDGALAASGGLDVVGRLWDVRTGRNVLTLEGHIKPILSMDFSPNGYLLATGSMDNTARIYDLRKRDVLAVLPGHTSLVSRVRFEPTAGSYLLTCGYDRASRLWAAPTFRLTKTLLGHEDKVMDGDVCPGEANALITSGYDRTIKVFGLDPSDAPMEEA